MYDDMWMQSGSAMHHSEVTLTLSCAQNLCQLAVITREAFPDSIANQMKLTGLKTKPLWPGAAEKPCSKHSNATVLIICSCAAPWHFSIAVERLSCAAPI